MTAKELYKIDFTKGLDLGTEPNASPTFDYFSNYVFENQGGIRKRPGWEPVNNYFGSTYAIYLANTEPTNSQGTVEQTKHMTSYRGSIIRAGQSKLYADGYTFKDMLPNMTGTYDSLAASTNSLVEPSSLSVKYNGNTIRVVIFREEVSIPNTVGPYNITSDTWSSRYTNQYQDYSALQNTNNTWTLSNNAGRLLYSVYVNDSCIVDSRPITTLSSYLDVSHTIIGAQLVSTASTISIVYAVGAAESPIGTGTKSSSNAERTKCSLNKLAFRYIPIASPSTISNEISIDIPQFDTPEPSTIDVRVHNVCNRIPTLVIDTSRTYVISGANITVPYKIESGFTADPTNKIRPGDKIVLKKQYTTYIDSALGYMTVLSVDETNKTFTVKNNTTNVYLNTGTQKFDVEWELHRIDRQHYHPMFCVSSSQTEFGSDSRDKFLVAVVSKRIPVPSSPSTDSGYLLIVRELSFVPPSTTVTATDLKWNTWTATGPTPDTGAAGWGPSDNIVKTFVSAFTMSCDIASGNVYLSWAAVKRTLTSDYSVSDTTYGIGVTLLTPNTSTTEVPLPRPIVTFPQELNVRTIGSVSYIVSPTSGLIYTTTVFTTYRGGYSSRNIVNGSYLFDADSLSYANGNDLVISEWAYETLAYSGTTYIVPYQESQRTAKDMNARMAAPPWVHNGSVYVAMYVGKAATYSSDEAASLVVYDLMIGTDRALQISFARGWDYVYKPRAVCNILPRQIFYQNLTGNGFPRYHIQFANIETTSNGYRFVSTISTNTTDTGISSIIDISLDVDDFRNSCVLNNTLFLSGGVPSGFDGTKVYELGSIRSPVIWHTFPDPIVDNPSNLSKTATWYYKAVYEWIDQSGNLYRSSPSDVISLRMYENGMQPGSLSPSTTVTSNPFKCQNDVATVPGGTAIVPRDIKLHAEFDHSTLRSIGGTSGESRNNPVKVVFYRSLKNDDTNFYRVNTMPVVVNLSNDTSWLSSGTNDYGLSKDGTVTSGNNPAPVSLTFTDIFSDSDISDNELLYDLNGAILANQSPPSSSFVCTHKNRVWLAGTPDDSIWYSKTAKPATEPGFNEVLTIPRFEGGRVVGMASLDDYLVVFKSNSVWVIQGDGPDDSGSNSTLQTPIRVIEGTGCISPGSIIVVGDAVYFQSMDGIYRMRRGSNQAELISQPIREITVDYLKNYNVKVSAVTYTSVDNSIRFAFYGKYTSGTYTYATSYLAIYNMNYGTWSHFTYAHSTSLRIVASCEHNGLWHGVGDNNLLIRENRSVRYDGGPDVKYTYFSAVQVGMIRLGEMAGLSRVQRCIVMGRRIGSAQGRVIVSLYSYAPYLINSSNSRYVQSGTYGLEYIEFPVKYQKVDSVQIYIAETSNYDATFKAVGNGESIVITGLVLYGNPMRGKAPKPRTISRKTTV